MTPPVVLITGGTRGIGRAAAQRLKDDGFTVAVASRSIPDAENRLDVHHYQVDVSDGNACKDLITTVEDEVGDIDVLINSAGIVRDSPLLTMTGDDWNDVIRTNLDGTYNMCRSMAFSMMKRKNGSIINLSSVAGIQGNPTQSNYSASKAGIIGFSKALSKELGRFNIRVNVVAPGFIETDMTADLAESVKKKAVENIPLGRMGSVDDVAHLVGFLASPRATYMTGAVVPVDGGIIL
ncbi:3-oxoacyl-ACP reductase FabG [Haloglycomyces albus]|uniref:3-oxoacyl-ACP reductase FabG n=1 Tax=Haloglycomyces albus TaxID=526067 RepID=UPI00046CB0D6|nr:3-oxoacyl-ACP reductase FabG [Haloglycomyces albus]